MHKKVKSKLNTMQLKKELAKLMIVVYQSLADRFYLKIGVKYND